MQMRSKHLTHVECCAQKVSGNAAKSGISAGDTVVYTSSFFGDELWPSDALSFTQSALKAAPSPVTLVFVGSALSPKPHASS